MIVTGEAFRNLFFAGSCGAITIFSSFFLMHHMNMSMKYYDQMEVVPTFQACVIVTWLMAGSFILRETKDATNSELIQMALGAIIIIFGVHCLVSKQTKKSTPTHIRPEYQPIHTS